MKISRITRYNNSKSNNTHTMRHRLTLSIFTAILLLTLPTAANTKRFVIQQQVTQIGQINTLSETSKSFADSGLVKIKATIEKHIRAAEGRERFIQSNNNTEGVMMAISMMDATASVIREGLNTGNKETIALTKELEKKAIISQEASLPELRAIYGNFLKEKLGEHNFIVALSGEKRDVLSFIGHDFADNKNIEMFQDNLSNMLHLMRFKQIKYRWSLQGDDYKCYTLDTPPDDKVVYHLKHGDNYRYY